MTNKEQRIEKQEIWGIIKNNGKNGIFSPKLMKFFGDKFVLLYKKTEFHIGENPIFGSVPKFRKILLFL